MIGIGLERNSGSILGLAQRKLPLYSQNLESLKCFNQTGSENMGSPQSFKHRPLMLFATDHEYLKNDFSELLEKSGFDGQYSGNLSTSVFLEYLATTWIHLAVRTDLGRNFTFNIEKR